MDDDGDDSTVTMVVMVMSMLQSLERFFSLPRRCIPKLGYPTYMKPGWWFQLLWKIWVSWEYFRMEKQNMFQNTNQNDIGFHINYVQ